MPLSDNVFVATYVDDKFCSNRTQPKLNAFIYYYKNMKQCINRCGLTVFKSGELPVTDMYKFFRAIKINH